jgi:hypothetical protein
MAEVFKTVTICGSMRYFDKMIEVAGKLTSQGWIVLAPFVANESGTAKEALDRMHKAKIDLSSDICVIGTHIGESTSSEIDYAKARGVAVNYWTEHFGMQP